MSMDIFEEKEHHAEGIIKEALSGKDRLFVLYRGDKAGLVLLHLLRTINRGNVTVPVINLQFMPIPGEALRFTDKLMRMWSLDFVVARFPEKPDSEQYTEKEVFTETSSVLSKLGAKRVLSACVFPFEGDVYCKERQGWIEFRPLCGFSNEDISAYTERYRLPVCSVGLDGVGAANPDGDTGRAVELDKKELADRLRNLGYL